MLRSSGTSVLPTSAAARREPVEPLPPLDEPVRLSDARTCRATGSTCASGCPWTGPTSSSRPRWPWTSSVGWRRLGCTSGWSGASTWPTACTPRRGGSSTGCRWASSAWTWPTGSTPNRAEAALDSRSLDRFALEGPTAGEPSRRSWRRTSAAGCSTSPRSTSARTPSAGTRCCTMTRSSSTPSWTGSGPSRASRSSRRPRPICDPATGRRRLPACGATGGEEPVEPVTDLPSGLSQQAAVVDKEDR